MSKQPSLDQKRAKYAWEKVQGCNSEYTTLAKAAPALIMNNGLMQTLAFYEDKGKNYHTDLNKHLIGWLALTVIGQEGADFQAMMNALLQVDSQKYRKATEETLALLRWIRQFAAISQ